MERRSAMKQWLAIFAAVAFLTLPAMVQASDETEIPPEANWSPTPPTPAHLVVSEQRVVSTAQEQASDTPRRATVRANNEDAKYQMVNSTVQDD
jgi:hypothetical protein